MTPLADACLRCHPGDAPAAKPLAIQAGDDGLLTADYACSACGLTWRTSWTFTGWPAVRDYKQPEQLLAETISLLACLLDGEKLEAM